jgi:dTDP-4-amino-4,6-dideoxygalactose transaminase
VSSLGPYKITIVDLRSHDKIRDEVRMAIDEVTDSQQFILGPVVKRFEEQMALYLQCGFAIGVASGSDALLNLLRATYWRYRFILLRPAQQECVAENIQAFFRR